MTLDNIDVSTISGQQAAEVRQENGELVSSNSGNTNELKDTVAWDSQESALNRRVSNVAPSNVDLDIARTFSQNTNFASRTTGRETDMMYADMLRTIN